MMTLICLDKAVATTEDTTVMSSVLLLRVLKFYKLEEELGAF